MHKSNLESKRVLSFRNDIIKKIPKFPNNRETLNILESKSLSEILLYYTNWASRLVPPRPRTVIIEPTLSLDPRWKDLAINTNILLDKVRRGDDLTPYLSLKIKSKGFSPNTMGTGQNVDKWADKDFLLNIMGYHHFHLSHIVESKGHTKRSDEVLFAEVTRETFIAIGFFNHTVFEPPNIISKSLEEEQEWLWHIFDVRSSRGVPSGSVYFPTLITTSGHRTQHTFLVNRYLRIIDEIEPKLDDISFVGSQFNIKNAKLAIKIKPTWYLNFLDLGIYDKRLNTFCIYQKCML